MPRNKVSNPARASHSVRVPDVVWNAARARSEREGTTMNNALNELMLGYAEGHIDLPRVVRTYAEQSDGQPSSAA